MEVVKTVEPLILFSILTLYKRSYSQPNLAPTHIPISRNLAFEHKVEVQIDRDTLTAQSIGSPYQLMPSSVP